MSRKYIHKRREIIPPSFPNNKLSSRPRKKKIVKEEWTEEDSQIYSRIPDSAISTPYDLPNPTDNAPSFFSNSYQEIYGGLSPTSNDTDGDGLHDGKNIEATYSLDGKFHYGESQIINGATPIDTDPYNIQGDTNGDGICSIDETNWLETNPLNPDSDGDSANDGQEALTGYDLTWMFIQDDGNVVDNDIRIDPVASLAVNPTNNLRDIDGDGLPDYYEANYEDFYGEFKTWAELKETETTNRWNAWNALPQSEKDDTENHPEPTIFNAQQYLDSQFNPFTKENTPPVIMDFYAETVTDWGKAWTIVDVYVTEVASYSVSIIVLDNGERADFTGSGGVNNHHHAELKIKYWSDAQWKYEVQVIVSDGWSLVSEEIEIKSAVAGLVDMVVAVFCGMLEAVADAVGEAMSFLADIVLAILTDVLGPLFEPLTNALNNLLVGFIHELEVTYEKALAYLEAGHEIPDSVGDSLFNYIATNIIPLLLGISLTMSISLIALNPLAISVPIVLPLITLLVAGIFIGILAPPKIDKAMGSLPSTFDIEGIAQWLFGSSSSSTSKNQPSIMSVDSSIYLLEFSVFISKGLLALASFFMIPTGGSFFSFFYTFLGFLLTGGALIAMEMGSSLALVLGAGAVIMSIFAAIIDLFEIATNYKEGFTPIAGEIGAFIVSAECVAVGLYVVSQEEGH